MSSNYNYTGVGPGVYFGREDNSTKPPCFYYEPKYDGPKKPWMQHRGYWLPEEVVPLDFLHAFYGRTALAQQSKRRALCRRSRVPVKTHKLPTRLALYTKYARAIKTYTKHARKNCSLRKRRTSSVCVGQRERNISTTPRQWTPVDWEAVESMLILGKSG
jgi:hypothetical protein